MSAVAFIVDLNATSLSMDENKFEESMQAAKLTSKVASEDSQTSQQEKTECSSPNKIYNEIEETRG